MNPIRNGALLLALAGLAALGSGCAMTPGGITDSTVPIEGRRYTNLGRVHTTDSRVHLFGLIPVSGANTTRDAIDACIRSRGGDAMISVTVESYRQWWVLFTRAVTRVDGDVIRFEK